jgi:hypothetical protein
LSWVFDLTIEDIFVASYPYAPTYVFKEGIPKSFKYRFFPEVSSIMVPPSNKEIQNSIVAN